MKPKLFLPALFVTITGSTPALAHLDPVQHGSFLAGFTHPLSGADHVLAMLAVGLWAAMLGRRALFALPAAFIGVMILGFVASFAGLDLPLVEPMILASVVIIGFLVALAVPMPLVAGAAIVGIFAFFHGHAHGGEMGEATSFAYGAGFSVATALLHGTGVVVVGGLARVRDILNTTLVARTAGGATVLAGLWLIGG